MHFVANRNQKQSVWRITSSSMLYPHSFTSHSNSLDTLVPIYYILLYLISFVRRRRGYWILDITLTHTAYSDEVCGGCSTEFHASELSPSHISIFVHFSCLCDYTVGYFAIREVFNMESSVRLQAIQNIGECYVMLCI